MSDHCKACLGRGRDYSRHPSAKCPECNGRSTIDEQIVSSAICMNKNGLVISLPSPARHCHVQQRAVELGLAILGEHEQGFLTSAGRFVRRAPARAIADRAGQLTGEPISHVFTSEELW